MFLEEMVGPFLTGTACSPSDEARGVRQVFATYSLTTGEVVALEGGPGGTGDVREIVIGWLPGSEEV